MNGKHEFMMKYVIINCLVLSIVLCGCGGEDFSTPPPQLASVRAKSQGEPKPDTPPAATSVANNPSSTGKSTPVGDDVGANGSKRASDAQKTEDDSQKTQESALSVPKTDADTNLSNQEGVSPSPVLQEKNSTSPAKNEGSGTSFLDTLKQSRPAKKNPSPPGARQRQGTNSVQRTGRAAINLQSWLQLKLAMSKRFFVATDATRIAASSSERSVGILSPRSEDVVQQLRGAQSKVRVTNQGPKFDLYPVSNLPAVVSSIELFESGNVVLVGTEDGRLLARSCADLHDRDLFAQDLVALQDEQRPATRISESSVIAVRVIDRNRIITVDGDNRCCIWKAADIVHQPMSPLEMTPDQMKSPEKFTHTAEPVAQFDLPQSQVLNLAISKSGDLCGVVTADEIVTIFSTNDGGEIAVINADQLDSTQPVSLWFEEQNDSILVGLADGRILRKALVEKTPVSGTDETGMVVDFEVLFGPENSDRSGAVTALAVTGDRSVLYFGRLDGTVARFDLPRRQLMSSKKFHQKAVIDIQVTANGTLSIGDDRGAVLFDQPNSGRSPFQNTSVVKLERRFGLPNDDSLPNQIDREVDQSQKDRQRNTRPRSLHRPTAREVVQDVNDACRRPANVVLALYEHQLRAAPTYKAASIRQKILAIRGESAPVEPVPDDLAKDQKQSPGLVGELQTRLDYTARPIRPLVMSVSNDGATLAMTQQSRETSARRVVEQPIVVCDVPTGTVLRTWNRPAGVEQLDLSWENQVLLPTPLCSRMNLQTGQLITDSSVQNTEFAWSYDRKHLVVGSKGTPGQATDVVALQTPVGQPTITGLEAFEGLVGALAYSIDGQSVFVSVRERSRLRLLELDSRTLNVVSELANEPMSGNWDINRIDRNTPIGPVHIVPSPGGRLLVTYGKYEKNYQLRIWKKTGTRWPQDQLVVIPSRVPMVESGFASSPMLFVNRKDNLLGIIAAEGLATIDPRSGELTDSLPIPDVDGRRPVVLLSRDGQFAFSGDSEGNIWVSELRALDRRPRKFSAQAGAITGIMLSPNGKYLATAGLENRIRVWDIAEFLNPGLNSPRN